MIREILADVNLLDHVPGSANLKKVGESSWRGRCPILDHATGGFAVKKSPRGHLRWMCFAGCGGGTVIDLVMKLDGISIGEAVKRLGKGQPRLSPEDRLAKLADAWKNQQPRWGVVCCNACPVTLGLNAIEEIVWTRWWMSTDGLIALCPRHATRKAWEQVKALRASRPRQQFRAAA